MTGMKRHTRYQGLIIQDHHLLLIQYRLHARDHTYWVIPGGGKEGTETDEVCVIREMKEETNLDVIVDRLILDEPVPPNPDGIYKWLKSNFCYPVGGVASPGSDPEPEAAAHSSIINVRWFDLRDERDLGDELHQNHHIYPYLIRLKTSLGYKN